MLLVLLLAWAAIPAALVLGGLEASTLGTPPAPSATTRPSEIPPHAQLGPTVAPSGVGRGAGAAQVGGSDFSISGGVETLMPGAEAAVRLTLVNPNDVPLFVTGLTVRASADSTPSGCTSARNIRITQSDASVLDPIMIPARGIVTLTRGPRAPQILLLDLPGVNQDACKNKTLALTYSGSARR